MGARHHGAPAAEPAPAVELIGAGKRYGPVTALEPTSLRVAPGSYFVLLGPSGGGKTTMLRLIGGLARPSEGRILLDGRDVTDLPPNRRNTSMVFQGYALFPHMTVEENVAYGLRLRKWPQAELRREVDRMLELTGLRGFNRRMPQELSGGQQQRVQLARSLVLHSTVLLLDEPLAALDAKLRKDMCIELKRIQERVGITFLHVTHNQEEAMTIADRIAIIAGGELIEQGSPREVYERPAKRFTADFIGDNNILDGRVADVAGDLVGIDVGDARIRVRRGAQDVAPGQSASLSVRPEAMHLEPADTRGATDAQEWLTATFVEEVYLGSSISRVVRLADGREVVARCSPEAAAPGFEAGQQVRIAWPTAAGRLHTE